MVSFPKQIEYYIYVRIISRYAYLAGIILETIQNEQRGLGETD